MKHLCEAAIKVNGHIVIIVYPSIISLLSKPYIMNAALFNRNIDFLYKFIFVLPLLYILSSFYHSSFNQTLKFMSGSFTVHEVGTVIFLPPLLVLRLAL